jgi:large subunit ribosomal protein L30
MTLLDNRPSFLGMLKRAKNFITWGEITEENILRLLERKGRLIGNKKLSDEYSQKLGYDTLAALAEAIHKSEVEFWNLPNIKPVFRGRPPKKGYKGKIKKSYAAGGVTGYRGQAINSLIGKMV